MQYGRNLYHTSLGNTGKIHHAEGDGEQIACHHTDEDGSQLPDALAEMIHNGDNRQGEESHQPVLPGTVGTACNTAGHIVDSGGIQGKTNGENDGAGDQRGEKDTDLFHQQTHENGY